MLDLTSNAAVLFSLDSLYPLFIGWFWNDVDQKYLHEVAQQYLKQLFSLTEVSNQLQDKIRSENLNDYCCQWVKRLHVTAMFLGLHKCEKNDKYISLVWKECYKANKITISGLLLTPRRVSGHVELGPDAEWMSGEIGNHSFCN